MQIDTLHFRANEHVRSVFDVLFLCKYSTRVNGAHTEGTFLFYFVKRSSCNLDVEKAWLRQSFMSNLHNMIYTKRYIFIDFKRGVRGARPSRTSAHE